MTNMYIRIQRDGVWQAIEIDNLSDAELETFFTERSKEEHLKWIKGLCKWIQENVRNE